MAGRKEKYNEFVRPYLNDIKKWIREDKATERQIAKRLGISYQVFNNYKVRHKELSLTLREAKRDLTAEIEESLYKRATGFMYKETKTRTTENPDGTTSTFTETCEKYALPDVGAQIFALKNLSKGKWSNSPAELELKKQEFELKKEVSEINNF